MTPNPILPKLGFSANDRAVIFHADDIGSCHSAVAAFADLLDFGLMSSAAVMMPCPWAPAVAEFIRARAADPRLDVGVHLTLNSEWSGYRWGPLVARAPGDGLLDDEGYFHHRSAAVHARANLAAVERELRAQIEQALAMGVDVTHIDSHMLTLFHPRLSPIYLALGRAYRLPVFMLNGAGMQKWFGPQNVSAAEMDALAKLEAEGAILFDSLCVPPLDRHENRLAVARRSLDEFGPGLHYFAFHPCHDTPELRAMAPDWRSRVADWHLFTSDAWRQAVAEAGVKVVGYRVLRDLIRDE